MYDTLSNMWGDPTPTDIIHISGEALPIAENLATALYHLRHQNDTLSIWVDAVCINQNDLDERSTQVQLMKHVYKRASTVRIWINEPSVDGTSDAVTTLQQFDEHLDENDPEKALGDDPAFWESIMPIFRSGYWRRAWIQQEVVNASQCVIHCLDLLFPSVSIAQFWSASKSRCHAAYRVNTATNIAWVNLLFPAVKTYTPATLYKGGYMQFPENERLVKLLWTVGALVTTDARDQVYALMHLAKDYTEGGIMVDYTKTVIDVAIDPAAYIIGRHCKLDILQYSYLDRPKGNTAQELPECEPSWLPGRWLGRRPDGLPVADPYICSSSTTCSPTSLDINRRRLRI